MGIRLAAFSIAFVLFVPNFTLAQTSPAAVMTPTAKDPQALSVINQVLAAAGGGQAVIAVADFTGTGNVTYHSDHDVQGTVTVRGLGQAAFRIDASLSSGMRSWAVNEGIVSTKDENGTITSLMPTINVPSSDAFPYQSPAFPTSLIFPNRQLLTVINNAGFRIAYNGVTEADGHSVDDIEFQRLPHGSPTAGSFTLSEPIRQIFVDTSTLQIVMMKETLPKGIVHQVHYSNYQVVNGLLMPLTISEDMAGQPTWTIQLTQFSFNTGLQVSSFVLQ